MRVALSGYIGTSDRFIEAVTEFAVDYADQTEVDYKTFLHSRFAPRAGSKKGQPAKTPVNVKLRKARVIKESVPQE